jgi:uncharacterized Zn-binding protein involved in type VI secretion
VPGAVRIGDPTVHGGVVTGPGVATVLIGGQPAAVVGDLHSCAIPPPSHVPVTPFVAGSATVLIGGRPAVRVGDSAGCGASAPVGLPTVLIG